MLMFGINPLNKGFVIHRKDGTVCGRVEDVPLCDLRLLDTAVFHDIEYEFGVVNRALSTGKEIEGISYSGRIFGRVGFIEQRTVTANETVLPNLFVSDLFLYCKESIYVLDLRGKYCSCVYFKDDSENKGKFSVGEVLLSAGSHVEMLSDVVAYLSISAETLYRCGSFKTVYNIMVSITGFDRNNAITNGNISIMHMYVCSKVFDMYNLDTLHKVFGVQIVKLCVENMEHFDEWFETVCRQNDMIGYKIVSSRLDTALKSKMELDSTTVLTSSDLSTGYTSLLMWGKESDQITDGQITDIMVQISIRNEGYIQSYTYKGMKMAVAEYSGKSILYRKI